MKFIPIRQPGPLQRLAWVKEGKLACCKDMAHPNGTLMFQAGKGYSVHRHMVLVEWREPKPTATGGIQPVEYSGYEMAFVITDDSQTKRWFIECRLGRNAKLQPVTDNDFNLADLIAHFEIPEVPTIAEHRAEEYASAKERIMCLTSSN